ncbi:phage tail tape measure protein [Neorhizobium sp. DAR64862/K0K3]|uniref:phage tail tape measure protein n=1 Tax=Neorhizobium sp. DAR64862/K0K3 TaxID=3421957 RepID=UPI003D2897C5
MASAVIGALRVNLGIDSAEFQNGLKKAQASLSGVGKSMQSAGKSMSAYLTAPLAAMGALTIKTAGDFESSMNRVQASTSASSDQFTQMQKLALELGANTSKSASEAADSMEMLAKNGVGAEDILNGAAAASIKLSEATGGDLSTAADVATNVMAQFKIEVKDLGKVVDGITNVTLASQFGFNDYKDALGQAGGVAGALGVSLQEFNAAIAATSSVFNSGSDAGTSFKTFLTTLVPKSLAAQIAMKELGLEFFNADGSMKSMSAIAEELKTGLAGLSDEARNNAVKEIFGIDAMRTAIALADQGAAGIDKMTETVARTGSANEQSAARMKGFNGELEKLSGALETLSINIANSGLLAFATSLVSALGGLVDKLSETNPEILKWGTVVAGVGLALGPVVIAAGLFVSAVAAISAPVLLTVAAVTALAAAGIALYTNWDQVRASFPGVATAVETTLAVMKVSLTGLLENARLMASGVAMALTGNFAGAWTSALALVNNFWQTFGSIADTIIPGFTAKVVALVESVKQMATEIVAAFTALPSQMIAIGGQIIDGLWQGIKAKAEALKTNVMGIASSIVSWVKNPLDVHSPSRVMHEIGVNVMQGLSNGMTSSKGPVLAVAGSTASGIKTTFDGLDGVGSSLGQGMESAFSGVGSSIADAIKGTKDWKDVALDAIRSVASSLLSSVTSKMGGGGGGLGGIFTGLLGGLFGFANGGSFNVGGAGGIDSQLVAFKASPNETVSVTKPGQRTGGGGTLVFSPTIDARGADQAGLSRVQRQLDDMQRNFGKMVDARGKVRDTRGVRG